MAGRRPPRLGQQGGQPSALRSAAGDDVDGAGADSSFDAIRFPIRFPPEQYDDLEHYDYLVEVALPDGTSEQGEIRINGDTLLVRYIPRLAGRHSIEVFADASSICPPQVFMVREDGSSRRIKAVAKSGSSGRGSPKKERPGSAGSTRSTRSDDSAAGEAGGGLSRNSSNVSRSSRLSTTSSLDRLANAPVRYSTPNSPDDSERVSAASSQEEEQSDENDQYADDDVINDEYYDEDDEAIAEGFEEPIEPYRPLKKYTGAPSHQQQTAPMAYGRSSDVRQPYRAQPGQLGNAATAARRQQQRSLSASAIPSHPQQAMMQRTSGRRGHTAQHSKSTEVFTSATGNMFILVNGTAQQLTYRGQSPNGAAIAQAADGNMWLVKGNKATPFQKVASRQVMMTSTTVTVGDEPGEPPR